MKVIIKQATTKADIRKFIDFPHQLYKDDSNYVPELYIAQKKLFSRAKNPFFRHADVACFLAYMGNTIAGRIAAIKNDNHNSFSNTTDAFFGFFDVIPNYEVAKVLLDAAAQWARSRKLSTLTGPVNFSVNDTCGMLIDGFESPPVIMMTYHKKYHNTFLKQYGFKKKMDLLAYRILPESTHPKFIQLRHLLEERLQRNGITIRTFNMKDFRHEVDSIHTIYNRAWEKNWGFVPMTKDEFYFAADDLKSIVDTDFAYIAEYNGQAIGFSLTIPNLNEIFIKIKKGRLLPTGIFKLLYLKNKIKSVRVITLGIVEEYRKTGIDACFYARSIEAARKKHIQWAEASWILENNVMMNKALQNIGAEVYKKYRIYEHILT